MPTETFYISYHLKAHTISNKLVIKISAQKNGGGGGGGGGGVMTATNVCSNFGGKWDSLPLAGSRDQRAGSRAFIMRHRLIRCTASRDNSSPFRIEDGL